MIASHSSHTIRFRRIVECIIFFLLLSSRLIAQNANVIDSLNNELKKYEKHKVEIGNLFNAKMDSTKVNLLDHLCAAYGENNPEMSFKLANEMITLSTSIGYISGLFWGNQHLGVYYRSQGNFTKALMTYEKSYAIAKQLNDQYGIAATLLETGLIYEDQGNYRKAVDQYLESFKIFDALRDTNGIISISANLGIAFMDLKNYRQSLTYFEKELHLLENVNDSSALGGCYINMGLDYFSLNKLDTALEFFQKGVDICRAIGNDYFTANGYENIGDVFLTRKQWTEALDYYTKGLDLFSKIREFGGIVNAKTNIAQVYYEQHNFEKSIGTLNEILSMKNGELGMAQRSLIYESLSKNFLGIKDYKNALIYQQLFKQTSDSMLNAEQLNTINQAHTDFVLNEQHLKDSMQMANAKMFSELKAQRKEVIYTASIALLGVIALVGFIVFRNRKKLEQQRLLMEERSRISRELHDDVGSTLSSIRMMSEIAKKKLTGQNTAALQTLEKISYNSGEMQEKMSDLVWALQNDNDSMEKVIAKIRKYAVEITEVKNIELIFEHDDFSSYKSLPVPVRQNIYLIAKEAINNAMKYADCTRLKISIKNDDKSVRLTINDNGKGFDLFADADGNGLHTMKKRAEELRAELKIETQLQKGTTVSLTLKTT